DYRRRSIVDVGRSVVGQALEIGPDQGFVGRWQAPAVAVIELRGEHDDEFRVCLAVRNAPAVRTTIWWPGPVVAMTLYKPQPGVEGCNEPAGHRLRWERAGSGWRLRTDRVKRHRDSALRHRIR